LEWNGLQEPSFSFLEHLVVNDRIGGTSIKSFKTLVRTGCLPASSSASLKKIGIKRRIRILEVFTAKECHPSWRSSSLLSLENVTINSGIGDIVYELVWVGRVGRGESFQENGMWSGVDDLP